MMEPCSADLDAFLAAADWVKVRTLAAPLGDAQGQVQHVPPYLR